MRARWALPAVAWCVLPWVVGCASFGAGPMGRAKVAHDMGSYPLALERARAQLAEGEGEPRREIEVRAFVLKTLGRLAELESKPTQFDDAAAQHYARADALAGDDPGVRAKVEWAMASYFGSTQRLRTALPHMRRALQAAERSRDAAVRIRALHGMAKMFGQMGELELERQYVEAALEAGESTVGAESEPEMGPALSAWLDLLDWHMQRSLRRPDARERVVETWPKMKRALRGVWGFWDKMRLSPAAREPRLVRRAILMMRAAAALAAVGEGAQARLLYDQVQSDLDNFGGRVSIVPLRNRLACTRARIHFSFGKLEQAERAAATCERSATSARDKALLERKLLTLLARIREEAGDLEAAAELYEKDMERFEAIRTAIPVEERETFFRGAARMAWEGLIRVRARQLRRSGRQRDLIALLHASDGMRARQLRELSGGSGDASFTMQALRRVLRPGDVVVSVVLAGSEVVVVGIDSEGAEAAIVNIAPAELQARLLRVTEQVARSRPAGELLPDLSRLGQTLLGPIAERLRGAERVAFVTDGALSSFPVELLVLRGRALSDRVTVAYSPSLAFLTRSTRREPDDRLYALGDPKYGSAPESVGYLRASELSGDGTRGAAIAGSFTPLPETRSEVRAIAELFEGRADVALGAEASEAALAESPPTSHRYVHFATHGILAGQLPGLAEPALVLAGGRGEDGFLTASEVARMRLEADLAVLSACSTGSGEMLPGEGVMGMGRAFMVAGSRGVVASLWPVDSEATEALMVSFYRHHRSGLDAARALHEAKREIAAIPKWRHPYYWAAFILVAEGGLLVQRPEPSAGDDSAGDDSRGDDSDDPAADALAGDDSAGGSAADEATPGIRGAQPYRRGLVLQASEQSGPVPGTYADDFQILHPFE